MPDALRLIDLRTPSGCDWLDAMCHAQHALWQAWDGLGLFWQGIIVISLLALILGALRGFIGLVKDVAGWPGVFGVAGIVLALIVALLPKRPRPPAVPSSGSAPAPGPPSRPLPFGTGRKRGERQYDSLTNTWIDR